MPVQVDTGHGVGWGGGAGFLPTLCPRQVVEDGYEFFAKRQLVTLFSAPNYCGEFDNAGAMMSVDETLMCSFQVSLQGGETPSIPDGRAAGSSALQGSGEPGRELTSFFPPSPPDFEAGRQEQGQIRAVQRAEPRRAPRHPSPKLCQSQEMSWEPPLCCPRPPAPCPSIRSLFFRLVFLFVGSCPPPRHAPPKQIQAQGRECRDEGGSLEPRAQPWGGSGGGGAGGFFEE